MGQIQITNVDNSIERQILIGMISSTKYLRLVNRIYHPKFLVSTATKMVANWCLQYYKEYGEAPKQFIQNIFEIKSKNGLKGIEAATIKDLLVSLSEESKYRGEVNHQYYYDSTIDYFKERSILTLLDDTNVLIDQGRLDKAEAKLASYKKIVHDLDAGSDPLNNFEVLANELDMLDEGGLFKLQGDLGELVGPIVRTDFIGIFAVQKRGKTTYMLEFAMQALYNGLNVAYFSMGDMTEGRMTLRFNQALTGLPLKSGYYRFPIFDCMSNQDNSCSLQERVGKVGLLTDEGFKPTFSEAWKYKPCTACRGVNNAYRVGWWWQEIKKEAMTVNKVKQMVKAFGIHNLGARFRQKFWSRGTAGMSHVRNTLDIWESVEGFIPDVIITDYADIMLHESGHTELRHQINHIWESHDSLAKDKNAVVITASQATVEAFSKRISPKHAAEDKRKWGHITKGIALNQTPREKEEGVMRISMVMSRNDEFNEGVDCYALQQLKCGQACLDSYLKGGING